MARSASTAFDPNGSATSRPARTVTTTTPNIYCPVANGVSWTLFREKCYYRYSAPFGIKGSSAKDLEKSYKTWFEAREECAKRGAKLASVHDRATQEMLLELIAGSENVTRLQETTWIGLQVGTPYNRTIINLRGEVIRVINETGCYWPAGVRPRLINGDPCWDEAVAECSVTYNDTYHGQWEDGKLYDEGESAAFWGPDEPSDLDRDDCDRKKKLNVDEQSRAYCARGVNGEADLRPHCAQILPADEKKIERDLMKPLAGKWAAYWCWIKNRGYICERPAKRSDGSDEVEALSTVATTSCVADTTTRSDDCAIRARGRTNEIQREINATRTGYIAVVESMALRDAADGHTWLGGTASFGPLAQSAIDFGRNIARLSAEECIPGSSGLLQQVKDLSNEMEGGCEKVENDLDAIVKNILSIQVHHPLMWIYENAVKALRQGNSSRIFRENFMTYCTRPAPADIIKNMLPFFDPSSPKDEPTQQSVTNLLSDLVENEPEDKTKQLLMVHVDAIARIGLVSLGACAQTDNAAEIALKVSSRMALNALSRVNDAFKVALQNVTSSLPAPPTPTAKDVVALINQTAEDVLRTVNGELDAKGWPGRELLHQKVVNQTVDRLNDYTTSYVFNALAYLPDDRNDRQCRQFTNGSVIAAGNRNLNFFVFYANESSKNDSEKAWKNLKDMLEAVLDHVFAKSNEDLCGRLTAELRDQKINKKDFRGGIAAVKCGYEFVWYELGYTYFYAAYSSTDYKWEKQGGAYDAKCGQIFFFP